MVLNFFLSLYCWIIISVFTVILGILAVITSFFSANVSQKIARLWGKVILKLLGIKVSVDGLENLDPSKSFLITSNHQSYFDIFVLLAHLDLDFRFIAKKSLFKIPFLGQSMKRLSYIPIDRENLRSALKSVKVGAELLKNKTSILIFPEGTRSSDGKILSFKKGGLNMFLKQKHGGIEVGMPVLPIVIKGTVNILMKNSLAIHPGKTVKLHILPPVSSERENAPVIIEKIEQETRRVLES